MCLPALGCMSGELRIACEIARLEMFVRCVMLPIEIDPPIVVTG